MCLSGGHHRRVFAPGVGLAAIEHPRCGLLHRLLGGGAPLRIHGRAEIFNTDQGAQFTSLAFTRVLREAGIAISMDGRGRALDNVFVERLWRTVKYEDIYPKGSESMQELVIGLTEYFAFYNDERPHQALNHRTPQVVHRCGHGGGAIIADGFMDVKTIREVVV